MVGASPESFPSRRRPFVDSQVEAVEAWMRDDDACVVVVRGGHAGRSGQSFVWSLNV